MSKHVADIVDRSKLRDFEAEKVRDLCRELDFIDPEFKIDHYVPAGPVSRQFILSDKETKVIMGPLGGGKTTACVFLRIYAATIAPIALHPKDGKPTRMCRWIVLRDTFRSVEKTVLESWKQWFPKGYPGSDWQGGNDRPVTHTLRFMGLDGVRIEIITEFAGLGENSIETLMKGREYSGAWLNELDTHAKGSLDDMEQRVGRYPGQSSLVDANAKRQKIVIGDMNAPTMDNWTYEGLVTKIPPGRVLFRQPSGRSKMAENRTNLPPDYYDRIILNQEERFIRRMVDNEFGYSQKGKPVHPQFSHNEHVAKRPIIFDPNYDLLVGIDISTNALTPAAVIGQNIGRILLLDEYYPGHGYGPIRFGEGLQQLLDERYPNRRKVRFWCDPAAQWGGDKEGGQLAALETLTRKFKTPIGIPFGGSNELSLRLEAVNLELRGYLEPDTKMLISPNCPMLIAAMAGKYRFKKLSAHAANEFEDKPEKSHPSSDLCDAEQYLIGGVRGRGGVIEAGSNATQKHGGAGTGWGKAGGNSGWGADRSSGFDPRKTGI